MNGVDTNVFVYAEAGVTVLYSEDLDPGTDYDGLAIVDPFA